MPNSSVNESDLREGPSPVETPDNKVRYSRVTQGLVYGTFILFAGLGIRVVFLRDWKVLAYIGVVMVVLSPLLMEMARPGKYMFRQPPPGVRFGLFWKLRLFYIEYSAWYERFFLGAYVLLLLTNFLLCIYELIRHAYR